MSSLPRASWSCLPLRDPRVGITQGVFTKLRTAINNYEQRKGPFAAWLLRVARSAGLDHMHQADDPHRGDG